MEPAKSIVARIGGPRIVSGLLGLTPGALTKWWTPRERGGCGGLIPSAHIVKLIPLARARGVFLEPNMFFEGHI